MATWLFAVEKSYCKKEKVEGNSFLITAIGVIVISVN